MEIEGYNNYLIYEDGRVSSKRFPDRFLKPRLVGAIGNQYISVVLSDGVYKKQFKIHRLVEIHYIPNPDNKRCVDHINRITTDNSVENLRWATDVENQQNTIVRKTNKLGIKNIIYNKYGNKYRYKKIINGVKHEKDFKTLEDAIEYKKEYENDLKLL